MLSLAALLVLIDRNRLYAGTGFHLLSSLHHHRKCNNTHYKTIKHTVTLAPLLQYTNTDTHPRLTWSAQGVCESKIDHTIAIYLHCTEPEGRNSTVDWDSNTRARLRFQTNSKCASISGKHNLFSVTQILCIRAYVKGKGIPITGHEGPQGLWMQESTYS